MENIVVMILDVFDVFKANELELQWEDLTIWCMDVAAAYTLLDISAKDAHLFSQELLNGLVFVHHGGSPELQCYQQHFNPSPDA
jgi:hypothetical protein